MQPVLFDTSIYITALGLGVDAALGLRRFAGGAAVWLSSVVLEQLYAGVSVQVLYRQTASRDIGRQFPYYHLL